MCAGLFLQITASVTALVLLLQKQHKWENSANLRKLTESADIKQHKHTQSDIKTHIVELRYTFLINKSIRSDVETDHIVKEFCESDVNNN